MKDLAELERLGQISADAGGAPQRDAVEDGRPRGRPRHARGARPVGEGQPRRARSRRSWSATPAPRPSRARRARCSPTSTARPCPSSTPTTCGQYATRTAASHPPQAHQELTTQFKSIHEKAVGDALPGGLDREGRRLQELRRLRQQGRPVGRLPHRASPRHARPPRAARRSTPRRRAAPRGLARGDASTSGTWRSPSHGGPEPGEIGPRIAPQEFPGIAQEQVKAIAEKADPKSVAKALDRVGLHGPALRGPRHRATPWTRAWPSSPPR